MHGHGSWRPAAYLDAPDDLGHDGGGGGSVGGGPEDVRDAGEKGCGMVSFGGVVEDDAGRGAMAQEGAGDVAPDGWLGRLAACVQGTRWRSPLCCLSQDGGMDGTALVCPVSERCRVNVIVATFGWAALRNLQARERL